MITKLDLFGVQPKIYIDQKEKYQTKFGVFLSFCLFSCLIIACWVYGKDMYYKENPQTTVSEEITKHPERFNITKDTFNFGISLQNSGWAHYIDESIYRMELQLRKQIVKGGEVFYENIDLKPRPCTIDDFQVDQQFFAQLGYVEDLYCIGNWEDVFVEGDFGAEIFSTIYGSFYKCQDGYGVTCKSDEEIEETLNGGFWAIYFTDQILDPKKFETPFTSTGRSEFGFVSENSYNEFQMNFQNVYLEDNTGLIFDKIREKKGFSYSQTKESSKATVSDGNFLNFSIRLQKVKQTRIYRNYLNFASVIANVGGILKVFTVGFALISWVISQQLLNLKIANELFLFKYDDKQTNGKKHNKNNHSKLKSPEKQKKIERDVKLSQIEKKQINNNSTENSGKIEKDYEKQYNKQKTKQNSDEISNSDGTCSQKPRELIFKNFFMSFLGLCRSEEEKNKKQLFDFANEKIRQSLSVQNLISKITEIEKLKMLLLTDEQQKLFEFLPKPEIDKELLQQKKEVLQEVMIQKQLGSNNYVINSIQKKKKSTKLKQNLFNNVILQDHRTFEQKKNLAFQAFSLIMGKKQKDDIDRKILKLMDDQIHKEFKEQQQDLDELNADLQSNYNSILANERNLKNFQNYNNNQQETPYIRDNEYSFSKDNISPNIKASQIQDFQNLGSSQIKNNLQSQQYTSQQSGDISNKNNQLKQGFKKQNLYPAYIFQDESDLTSDQRTQRELLKSARSGNQGFQEEVIDQENSEINIDEQNNDNTFNRENVIFSQENGNQKTNNINNNNKSKQQQEEEKQSSKRLKQSYSQRIQKQRQKQEEFEQQNKVNSGDNNNLSIPIENNNGYNNNNSKEDSSISLDNYSLENTDRQGPFNMPQFSDVSKSIFQEGQMLKKSSYGEISQKEIEDQKLNSQKKKKSKLTEWEKK